MALQRAVLWNTRAKRAAMWNPPDSEVIQRLADGKSEALGEIYDRYAGLVNGIARRILKDSAEAEDVVQTVFVQVWQQAHRYDASRGTVPAWLCTLARTRALDSLRTRLSRREASRETVTEAAKAPATEEAVAVRQALRALPTNQRRTLELAYFEGLTQVEIAERLGQPVGTVKTRARAALKRLRTTLAPVGAPDWDGGAAAGHALLAGTHQALSGRTAHSRVEAR
jgi:RNA polymerase sigma-70 factor (ECF subfamily)